MIQLKSGKYFQSMALRSGDFVKECGVWMVVEGEPEDVKIMTPDGPDWGWAHTLRPATEQEIKDYEAEEARWEAMTPAERKAETMKALEAMTPGLDW